MALSSGQSLTVGLAILAGWWAFILQRMPDSPDVVVVDLDSDDPGLQVFDPGPGGVPGVIPPQVDVLL